MQTLIPKLKKYWWLTALAVIIVFVIIYSIAKPAVKFEYTTETVKRGNLVQTVEATGSILTASNIELNFPIPGRVVAKKVKVGDAVKAGQILVQMDNRELLYRMNQAGAAVAQAQANLDKILAGATNLDLAITEKSVASAKTDYDNAVANLEKVTTQVTNDLTSLKQTQKDTLTTGAQNVINYTNSALATIDDSLTNCNVALAKAKEIREDSSGKGYYAQYDPQAKANEAAAYETANLRLTNAKLNYQTAVANKSVTNIDAALNSAVDAVTTTFSALNALYSVLSNTPISDSFTSTTLTTFKATVATQISTIGANRTGIETARQYLLNARISEVTNNNTASANVLAAESTKDARITTAQNQVNTAKAGYDVALAQLNYKQAPAQSFDIASYRANVSQLASSYQLARKNYEDATIKAPIEGTITAINYEIGELTSAAKAVVVMNSSSGFKIEVDISESDIAKLQVNNPVQITLDAFGAEQIVDGHVTAIDPAQTVIQEVIYYKVTINFDKIEDQIKPGMTANLTISTANRNNVLFIPRRAVNEKEGKKYAKLLINGAAQEVEISTGLKGDNGLIEVTDGLNEGEVVITFTKQL